jgi:putative spermidine/putrescine transport system substrate-binding protein
MSTTKNRFSALIALFLILSIVLAGCAAPPPPASAPAASEAAAPAAEMSEMDKLVAAAQAEGSLTTIALPHDWCNYGEAIETFKSKYGIAINELDPNAGSGDEIEAVKANMNNKGPQAPDVLDVGFGFGPQLVDEKLSMPYKVADWETIPADAKHPDGYWVGDYYGVLAFLVNTDVVTNVPQDWADLLKPEYKGQIALAGDPRVSNQAIMAVYAAALANGGSLDDVQPGLDFFAELNASGNLIPVISKGATLAKGETPIVIAWDYNALSWQQQFEGNPATEVVVPQTGIIGGVYIQAISAYAPQPNAAKLWQEFLYSDEGQLIWLKGFCHPIRYNDLAARNVIPQEMADALPPADLYAKAVFPNLDQLSAAKEAITTQWDSVVGADVQAAP